MLVLTRKEGGRIRFVRGDTEIIVSVTQLKRTAVRLGCDAPDDWRIVRDELPPAEGNAGAGAGPSSRDGALMEGSAPSPETLNRLDFEDPQAVYEVLEGLGRLPDDVARKIARFVLNTVPEKGSL